MTETIPSRVGVLGGGRMGAGIAHAFLLAGADVVVVERDVAAAEAAQQRIEKSVDASIARGFDASAPQLKRALTVATDPGAFGACRLVIEAVPESLELKLDALREIERQLPQDAVLASNTSSIPLGRLADALDRPEQFIGLHFFNPVPASALVEIVVSARDIDLAMELGYRHPTGPLRTTDIVGLDVRLGIAEQLERELGAGFTPPQILRDMVAEGRLGRKSGQGFYDWNDE